ncbi:MAG TPA: 2-dehydro-3-deoxyphosphogluconate aldolase, partial [Clostridiales bacterium]|nr:2-dehydro-3-deoxyphosphogluconate aldolase [Clostridiales bacterium]
LFPNSEVKISYLKALAVPLSHIRFLAVGGVNDENLPDYLAAGAKGVGIATGIVNKKLIAAGDYAGITALAEKYVRAAQ